MTLFMPCAGAPVASASTPGIRLASGGSRGDVLFTSGLAPVGIGYLEYSAGFFDGFFGGAQALWQGAAQIGTVLTDTKHPLQAAVTALQLINTASSFQSTWNSLGDAYRLLTNRKERSKFSADMRGLPGYCCVTQLVALECTWGKRWVEPYTLTTVILNEGPNSPTMRREWGLSPKQARFVWFEATVLPVLVAELCGRPCYRAGQLVGEIAFQVALAYLTKGALAKFEGTLRGAQAGIVETADAAAAAGRAVAAGMGEEVADDVGLPDRFESVLDGAKCPKTAARCGELESELLGCFVAGTLVQMADGTTRPIEQIQTGELVWSRNPGTGAVEQRRVVRTSVRHVLSLLDLAFADTKSGTQEHIVTTSEHPFYVEGRGFLRAGSLGIGTQIVTRAGPSVSITSTEARNDRDGYTVYNLTVEGDHTYFVGTIAGGMWVHNACPPAWITPGSLPAEEDAAVTDALHALRNGTRPPYANKWGDTWENRGQPLPSMDGSGNPITYKEYYVRKPPSDRTPWGARRLVRGSDGLMYYTNDHYDMLFRIQ